MAVGGSVRRGVLETYDGAHHEADVRLAGEAGGLIHGAQVLGDCYGDWLAADDRVLVAEFPDNEAAVIGRLGAPRSWPKTWYAYQAGAPTFPAQAWTAWPNLSLSVTVTVASYILLWGSANMRGNAVRTSSYDCAFYESATLTYCSDRARSGVAVANTYRRVPLFWRYAVPAGTYTFTWEVYVTNAGDTVRGYRAAMMAVAAPQ